MSYEDDLTEELASNTVHSYRQGFRAGLKQARTMRPVSEPPTKSNYYLVYIKDEDYQSAYYCAATKEWDVIMVEYWMELPEVSK